MYRSSASTLRKGVDSEETPSPMTRRNRRRSRPKPKARRRYNWGDGTRVDIDSTTSSSEEDPSDWSSRDGDRADDRPRSYTNNARRPPDLDYRRTGSSDYASVTDMSDSDISVDLTSDDYPLGAPPDADSLMRRRGSADGHYSDHGVGNSDVVRGQGSRKVTISTRELGPARTEPGFQTGSILKVKAGHPDSIHRTDSRASVMTDDEEELRLKQQHQTRFQYSIPTVMIIVFMTELLLLGAIVSVVSWWYARNDIASQLEALREQVATQVHSEVRSIFADQLTVPETIAYDTRAFQVAGAIGTTAYSTSLEHGLRARMEQYRLALRPTIGVVFTNGAAETYIPHRTSQTDYTIISRGPDPQTGSTTYEGATSCHIGSACSMRSSAISSSPTYDLRTESWYTLAIGSTLAQWDSVRIDNDRLVMAGSTSIRTPGTSGSLLGVSYTEFDLERLSQRFAQIKVGVTGSVYLVDAQGFLVASSMSADLVDVAQNRLAPEASSNNVIRDSAIALRSLAKWAGMGVLDVRHKNDDGTAFARTAPLSTAGFNGVIVLVIPLTDFDRSVRANTIATIVSGLLGAIIAVVLAALFGRQLALPLRVVTRHMDQVANLEFFDEKHKIPERKIELKGYQRSHLKEVAHISTSLDHMRDVLVEFARYVPTDVVRMLVLAKRPATVNEMRREDVSVLYSHLIDFSTVAANLDPTTVMRVLREYAMEVTPIITGASGTVDKFNGDALLAFWNAPVPTPNHEAIACQVALEQKRRITDLRTAFMSFGIPHLDVSIGVHTGSAIVGDVGDSTRANYTVMGTTVSVAARLAALNERYGTDVLISQSVHDVVNEEYLCRPLAIVDLPGYRKPVRLYQLVSELKRSTYEQRSLVHLSRAALNHYQDRAFSEAITVLKRFLKRVPGDLSATRLLERSRYYKRNPHLVTSEWTGVDDPFEASQP